MSKELVEALQPALSDNVVCIKLIDGTTIIALVEDDEQFTETIYLFAPKLMVVNEIAPDEWEYKFKEWLIGAEDEVQYIDESSIVVQYPVDQEMRYEYLEYAYPDQFSDRGIASVSDLSSAVEFLKDNSTVH